MNSELNQKLSISLPADLVRYTEQYQKETGLSSRSEVFVEALRALRERELAAAYEAWAEDYKKNPEKYAEYDGYDNEIAISDGSEWL